MLLHLLNQLRLAAAVPVASATILAATAATVSNDQATTLPEAAAQPASAAHALLDRIAAADKDLQAITANIRKTKEEKVLRRKEIHLGRLIYLVDRPEPESETLIRKFAILFDKRYHGSGSRLREDVRDDHFVFDGRWFADINHAEKQFIKTEIAPPGEHRDPLKLGEGPFPLPIGQDSAEVLARFVVTDAAIPEEGPLSTLPRENVQGLHLVPKPNTAIAEDHASFDIYYDLTLNLPIGVAIVNTNGNREWVTLTNVKRNPELTAEDQERLSIETPSDPSWRIDIRALGSS